MPPLVPQLIDIPIVGGVDEKTDDKLSMRWQVSKNVSRPKIGGITRRNSSGWLANNTIAGAMQLLSPRQLRPLLGAPAVVQDNETLLPKLYPYVLADPAKSGFSVGPLQSGGTSYQEPAPVVADHWAETPLQSSADVTIADSAYTFFTSASGQLSVAQLTAVVTPTGVHVVAQHYAVGPDPVDITNVPIAATFDDNSITEIRRIAKPSTSINGAIVIMISASTSASYLTYNPLTASFGSLTTFNGGAAFTIWDWRMSIDNTYFTTAYVSNATTITVFKRVLAGGATMQTITTATAALALSVTESDQDLLRVMWCETTAKTIRLATSTMSALGAFTTQAGTIAAPSVGTPTRLTSAESSTLNSGTGVGSVYLETNNSGYFAVFANNFSAAAANALSGSWVDSFFGVYLASKPLAERGGSLILLANAIGTTQRTYFLALLRRAALTYLSSSYPRGFFPVAKTAYAVAGGALATLGQLPNMQPIPNLTYPTTLWGAKYTLPSGAQTVGTQIVDLSSLTTPRRIPRLFRWMFDPIRGLATAKVQNNQFFGGGAIYQNDGSGTYEQGFWLAPEIQSISAAGAAGSLSAGQYAVILVFSSIDSKGNIVRSAPSLPQIVTAVALNTISVAVDTLYATMKWTHTTGDGFYPIAPVSIELYRTVVGGTTYYRDTTIALNNNNQSTSTPTLTTSVSDATIQSNQILYTAGSLNSYAPDGTGVMGNALGRLWCADPLDNDVYRWSQTPVQGQGLTFAAEFYARLPAGSPVGRITAFMAMDDKCVMSKRGALWYVSGDGPTINGTGSFTSAIRIPGDIGVLNQNAWALTSAGIVFVSEKGVWLLGRDLSLTPIGKDVENYFFDYPASDPTMIPGSEARALLVEDQNQVRFIFRSASLGARVPLIAVYDYFQQTWDYHEPMASSDLTKTFAISDLLSISGQIYQAQIASDGTAENLCVAQERYDFLPETTTLAKIPSMKLTSSWVKTVGMQGFEVLFSLYFLLKTVITNATYPTIPADWTLTVGIAYNYDPTIQETHTITYANMLNGGLVPQFRIDRAAQGFGRCQSFQLTIAESFPTTVGGFLWQLESLQAEIGVLPRGMRLPAAKRA